MVCFIVFTQPLSKLVSEHILKRQLDRLKYINN